jgi:hypothetical protein
MANGERRMASLARSPSLAAAAMVNGERGTGNGAARSLARHDCRHRSHGVARSLAKPRRRRHGGRRAGNGGRLKTASSLEPVGGAMQTAAAPCQRGRRRLHGAGHLPDPAAARDAINCTVAGQTERTA